MDGRPSRAFRIRSALGIRVLLTTSPSASTDLIKETAERVIGCAKEIMTALEVREVSLEPESAPV